MASPIYLWYSKEVFYWRSLAATVWSVICLPVVIFVLSAILNLSLTSPVSWISGAVSGTISIHFMVAMVTFGLAVVSVTWFSLPYLSVTPEINASRLSCLLSLFRWSRLPLLVVCVMNGCLCAWSITGLAGTAFTDYVITQEYEKTVLNEGCLFLLACGMFTGLCYYCQFFVRQEFYLSFPAIQRQKVFQLRSETRTLLERVAWQTLHVIKYFYILYFLFGSLPRSWICHAFGISQDLESSPLDSLVGLMQLSLLWKSYLTSFVFSFVLTLSFTLTRIFHTQQLVLPVTSVLEESSERRLSDALVCSYSPLLQHLALYDLCCLGKFVSSRLQELLSLSQPGGHPKIWLAVSQSALATVQDLTNRVKEENWVIMSRVPISHHHQGHMNGGVNGHWNPGSAGDRQDSHLTHRGTDAAPIQAVSEGSEKQGFMAQLNQRLSSLPVLSHLVTQSQDISSRRLFASCQKQIWAVESLSHIAVRAYTEDRYGVVQTSLPFIFTALLDLHECVEKHLKLSTSPRRVNGSLQQSCLDGVLRYRLLSGLKAALYRMANTYKAHLEDIKLRPDEMKKLTPFIQYTL